MDPNAGGFGQEESEIVLQNPIRIFGYLAFCFFLLLTQISLVLKKNNLKSSSCIKFNRLN
jgi:apocytochrome f